MNKNFLFVLLMVCVLFFAGCNTGQGSAELPSINVNGMGKVITEPDTLEIRISIETEGKDKGVQEINAEKAQKIIDALLALGLEKDEITTQNVNFYPMHKWTEREGNKIVGYKAENNLLVKTNKLDKAGEIIDKAVDEGAQRVGNTKFTLSDEGKEKLLDKAIEGAVSDARKQAEAAAKASGVKITGIKNITVLKNFGSAPIYYDNVKRMEAKMVETPIMPQDAEFNVSVDVEFKIQ